MFKKFREFKDKLTCKQAWGISIIIALFIGLIYALIFASTFAALFLLFSSILVCTIALTPMVFIFDLGYKDKVQQWEMNKTEAILAYNLSKDTYVKLKFLPDETIINTHCIKMLTTLLTNSNYSFWAKLTEEDNVKLIVKDVNDNILYDEIISNFRYLNAYFKPLN